MSLAIQSSGTSIVAAPAPAPAPRQGQLAPADQSTAPAGAAVKQNTSEQAGSTVKLSAEAQAVVLKLQQSDSQVRQHEMAHLAAAGGLATSGPTYVYQRGPDGNSYAIGGEVHIDVSSGRTPQETIARARIIRAAALAPADPSDADRAVALRAQQMEQQAQAELQQQRLEKAGGRSEQSSEVARAYDAVDQAGTVGQHIDVQG